MVAIALTSRGADGATFQPAVANAATSSPKNVAVTARASQRTAGFVAPPPSGVAPVNISANSTSTVIAPP